MFLGYLWTKYEYFFLFKIWIIYNTFIAQYTKHKTVKYLSVDIYFLHLQCIIHLCTGLVSMSPALLHFRHRLSEGEEEFGHIEDNLHSAENGET